MMSRTLHYSSRCALLLAVAIPLQVWRDRGWQAYEPATPRACGCRRDRRVKRLSLGFDALLADLYWIRAVVYFGRQRLSNDVGQELRPAVSACSNSLPRSTRASPSPIGLAPSFSSEPPPDGPGRPDLAISCC